MKHVLKRALMTGAALVSLVSLAGAQSGVTTLTLWHETEPKIAEALSTAFKPLEKEGIKVNVVRKDKITEALKLVGNDPKAAPDLFWFAHDKVGLFAAMGILEPVDDLAKGKMGNFIPMTTQAGVYGGKQYQIPAYFETLLFMYNKALMKTPPKTTDELLALMKKDTKADSYVYVEQHSTAYYAAAWMHPFGGWIINGKAEPGLSSAGTQAALAYHAQFVPYMPKDGEWNTVTTLFTEGKAASTLNGPWFVPSAREKGIDLGFAPLPTVKVNGKQVPLAPYAGVQGLMMLAASPNKAAARKVIQFALGRDLSETLSLVTGAAPAHKDAYKNKTIASNELVLAMKAAGEGAQPMPNIPQMDVMWGTTEAALVAINKQGADVKASLEKAQKDSLERMADMQ